MFNRGLTGSGDPRQVHLRVRRQDEAEMTARFFDQRLAMWYVEGQRRVKFLLKLHGFMMTSRKE